MYYDKKFREIVLKHIEKGKSQEETRKIFNIGKNTITEWKKLKAETGRLENRKLNRKPRKIDAEKLALDVKAYPEDFNHERAIRFGCSESGIEKALKREKMTRKKRA